tara:strand:- start:30 stop:257 length:228 start_codon:yes stop_codon:yes gene_type:complete
MINEKISKKELNKIKNIIKREISKTLLDDLKKEIKKEVEIKIRSINLIDSDKNFENSVEDIFNKMIKKYDSIIKN